MSKLKTISFQVPHGAVLTTLVFDKVIKKLGYSSPVPLEEFSEVYKKLNKPSKELVSFISSIVNDYMASNKNLSFRSSATIEDSSKDSMAGMLETYTDVSGKNIPLKILKVMQSAFSPKIKKYLEDNPALIKKLKMAVILQEMVHVRCAGVIFGAKIQTGNTDIVEIEANKGLGEGIVSGKAKQIEQYKFSRSERRVIEQKGPIIISQIEAKALFMLSERLRSEFNDMPQDIEWAIDSNGQIWVLQSRDLYIGK